MSQNVGSEIKLLSRHTSIYGLSNILNRIVSFVLLPVYTRYLSPADYGVMDLLYFSMAFVGIVLDMGITSAMSRFYYDSEDQAERNKVVTSTFYGFGVGSTVVILLLLVASEPMTRWILKEEGYTELMILAMAGLGTDMYIKVAYTYMRVRQRSLTLMTTALIRLVSQLTLNIIFIIPLGMGVRGILLSTLLVNIALCLFLIPYILRQTGLASSWPRFKEMVVFGLPLIPSNFLAYIVNVSDRYFVNAFSGLTATGLYTLGYRFGILVNEFVASPFGQTWIPRRYEMYKKGDSERVFAKIFTYFSALIFFVGLGISVVTKDVIQVMSDEAYWSAYGVVPIITLSYIFASFQMHFNIGIMIEKKTKYILYINMVTAALNLALNYFMIKEWGMWGAAWATLISFVGKVILVYWISNRLVRLMVEWGRVFKLTALAGLMYWPLTLIETGNPILNVLLKSLACLGYPFLLYAVGFFEPGEIRKGWDLARPYLGKVIPAFRR